jgi:hypothetical protein
MVSRKPTIHVVGPGEVRFAGTGGLSARTKKITEHEAPLLLPGPGRRRAFDVEVEQRLQKQLRTWLLGFRGDLPPTNSANMKGAVRKFAEAEGVPPNYSWRVMLDHVVRPVRRELRRRK